MKVFNGLLSENDSSRKGGKTLCGLFSLTLLSKWNIDVPAQNCFYSSEKNLYVHINLKMKGCTFEDNKM